MRIAFFGDSITRGDPGASYFDILEQELLEDDLVNYGRGGETVASLHRRIARVSGDVLFDLSFLWIGVNDIIFNVDWSEPISDDSAKKPWSDLILDLSGFYRSILEDVLVVSRKVVMVPPLFIGEDVNNIYNKRIKEVARNIEELTQQYENAEYLDLHTIFISKLEEMNAPDLSAESIKKETEDESGSPSLQTGAVSWQGKLHYTIDGVHLSDTGAQLAAEAFLARIKSVAKKLNQ